MKPTQFKSQWKDYPARIDDSMTRKRAALLLWAWRRNSRKNTNNPKWIFKRIEPHAYFVKVHEWDIESHTLYTR